MSESLRKEEVKVMSVAEAVRGFLGKHEYVGPTDFVDGSESLLERGIIDSVGVLKLVSFLEETYGIEIDEDDLMPENFDSLGAIEYYVSSKIN